MEHMDGNLYQLIKSREHKPLSETSLKSILIQILAGLEHIHAYDYFHRDIKPENILVSAMTGDNNTGSRRSCSSGGSVGYSIKLADFGLARETHARNPYTTYVSTRWYRAPEVLLRAGHYSSPVDIWALGAMAVEIATLKPLFPGANEVDQVWRVCEIMGSPGNWVNKSGARVGGGEWRDGVKLAQKLGFSFPKMAPHSLSTVLPSSQWSPSLTEFITWCLMWDPNARPTATQSMAHEYFADAHDPLRSTASKRLSRVHMSSHDAVEPQQTATNKTTAWLRRSLNARDLIDNHRQQQPQPQQYHPQQQQQQPQQHQQQHQHQQQPHSRTIRPAPPIGQGHSLESAIVLNKPRGTSIKTSAMGSIQSELCSNSPSSSTNNLDSRTQSKASTHPEQSRNRLVRQLSGNSHANHYLEQHGQEAEKMISVGTVTPTTPLNTTKESFFSHLRKKARRISGRYHSPPSPRAVDVDMNDSVQWDASSAAASPTDILPDPDTPSKDSGFAELDKVLETVRDGLEKPSVTPPKQPHRTSSFSSLFRTSPFSKSKDQTSTDMNDKNRKTIRHILAQDKRYDVPAEADELLNEALKSANHVAHKLDTQLPVKTPERSQISVQDMTPDASPTAKLTYLTPSPSYENNAVHFGVAQNVAMSKMMKPSVSVITSHQQRWPTPPAETDMEHAWAASASASICAVSNAWR